ncbi:MAG: NAD(P) transhydrogenase subunit alpha [Armatimonadetes bacterium]|nr:NAD(P) transhydrogenase subunit alpha [Armatimonadota bacterium]
MQLTICIVKETAQGEARVAIVPEVLGKFMAAGASVVIEKGAGLDAGIPDSDYEGARFEADAASVLRQADVLLKVQPTTLDEIAALKSGVIVVGLMQPHKQIEAVRALKDRKITSFAMELIPRISRAQSMDVLSSQASVAGYKAVLLAANALDKFLPMLTTAAGTIRPAQALIIGAGVAGLQAIATARRLGAMVEAFDVRSETKEQIESLGAKFVDTGVVAEGEGGYARELTDEERAQQQKVLEDHIAKADIVITTAAVPGRTAPRIISKSAVERMKPGAVIVDLACESGGNCELTCPGETVKHGNVTILAPLNIASLIPRHASDMYSRNLFNFLQPAITEDGLKIDWEDEVFAGAVLTHDGEIKHEQTRKAAENA